MNQRQSLNSAKKQQKHTQRGRGAEGTGEDQGQQQKPERWGGRGGLRRGVIAKNGGEAKQKMLFGEACHQHLQIWGGSESEISRKTGRIRIRDKQEDREDQNQRGKQEDREKGRIRIRDKQEDREDQNQR